MRGTAPTYKGVIRLIKALANQWTQYNIRVNATSHGHQDGGEVKKHSGVAPNPTRHDSFGERWQARTKGNRREDCYYCFCKERHPKGVGCIPVFGGEPSGQFQACVRQCRTAPSTEGQHRCVLGQGFTETARTSAPDNPYRPCVYATRLYGSRSAIYRLSQKKY